MENIGADEPFGGEFTGPDRPFRVDRPHHGLRCGDGSSDEAIPDVNPTGINFGPDVGTPDPVRKVALFEGTDEYGRLQPLLGTAEPATDFIGRPINWPNTRAIH